MAARDFRASDADDPRWRVFGAPLPVLSVTRRKPRCFVALAVGPNDVRRYYERLVQPILRHHGITPIVISRRESNDLNNQIIQQIDDCDLCIADLTYARPSVYFEAGYAEQRRIPVIYTVRKDHVGKDAVADERRVHFDLVMKPVITWSTPTERTFRGRLDRRLRETFLTTWRKEQQLEQRVSTDRSQFRSLPVKQRLAVMRDYAIGAFKRRGFRTWEFVGEDHPQTEKAWLRWTGAPLRSTLRKGSRLTVVTLHALHAATRADLEKLTGLTSGTRIMYEAGDSATPPKTGAVHTFVFALRPVPAARLETALPSYYPGQPPGHYVKRDSVPLFAYRSGRGGTLRYTATLDCISDVRSEKEFRAVLEERISRIANKGPSARRARGSGTR